MTESPAFPTAEWRHLVMLNFAVSHDLLKPHVPRGTILNAWQGRSYVSLVGSLYGWREARGRWADWQ